MTHEVGTYLGGVRTVEDLRQRCRIDHETGCWRWGMTVSKEANNNGAGRPKVEVLNPDTGKKTVMSGRRAALVLERGKDIPKGHVSFAKACCKWDDCVNPAHARSGSRHEHGEYLRRTGRVRGLNGSREAMIKRAKTLRRLTAEQVIEIRRCCNVPAKVYAERFGVSEFTIWAARKGHRYADVGRVTSVFDLAHAA